VRISYDPAKRNWTLANRGLDFEDAALVFDGVTAEVEDTRRDYGETRVIGCCRVAWWSSATPHGAQCVTSSACERPTIVSKPASRRTLGSDLKRVDAHVVKPEEYEELPEMTDEMFARAVFKKAGRPRSTNPKQMISLRLPPEVVARWKATGPGWQTRMAKRLEKTPLPRAESEAKR
jgi:uncharacterized protein (DUF4415 family)